MTQKRDGHQNATESDDHSANDKLKLLEPHVEIGLGHHLLAGRGSEGL